MPLVLKADPRSGTPSQSGFSTIPDADAVRMRVISNTILNINEEIIDGTSISAFQNALSQKSITRAIDALPFNNVLSNVDALAKPLGDTLVDGLVNAGRGLPTRVGFKPSFTRTDPRALQWAQEQSARLITNISNEQKDVIRSVIANAFSQQRTVDQTAATVRQFIGLTKRQENTMLKFNRNNVNRFVSEGMSISDAERKALTLAQKYRDKLIKSRARTIARTEIQMAQNNGRYLGFQQAVEQGYSPKDSIKRWVVANAACPDCFPLRGYTVFWDQEFPNGVLMPPAHPNCRCTAVMLDPRDALVGLPPDFKPVGPVPVAPAAAIVTPIPQMMTDARPGFKKVETAVDEAFDNPDSGSYFAYDSSSIEDFQIKTNKLFVNGVESTELRFKLTDDAKKRLKNIIETTQKNKWTTDDRIIIDKVHRSNRTLKVNHVDDLNARARSLSTFPEVDVDEQVDWVFHGASGKGFTFTKYQPDGTIIRFTIDLSEDLESFSFDGTVRVFINGRATKAQIDDVFSDLGIANRYPGPIDIDEYKKNRFLQMVDRRQEYVRTPATTFTRLKAFQTQYGNYDEMEFYQDSLGMIQVRPPKKLADTLERKAPPYYRHSLHSKLSLIPILKQGSLRSTTERLYEGYNTKGISSDTDIKTGGADFVFLTPVKQMDFQNGYVLFFNSKKLNSNRTDFYAYTRDSYGVRNPNYEPAYQVESPGDKDTIMNLETINQRGGFGESGEAMFRQRISLEAIEKIEVPTYDYVEFMEMLEKEGIDTIGGKPVRDVIVTGGKTYLSKQDFIDETNKYLAGKNKPDTW
jgi:hypothetical protein